MSDSFINRYVPALFSRSIVPLLSIIATPILVRELTVSEYGILTYILSLSFFLKTVTGGGIPGTIRRFLPEKENQNWKMTVFGYHARLCAAIISISSTTIIIIWYMGYFRAFMPEIYGPYIPFVAIFLIINIMWMLGRNTVMAMGAEHISEPLSAAQQIIYLTVALVSTVVFGFGVEGPLLGMLFSFIIVGATSLWFARRHFSLLEAIKTKVDMDLRSEFNHVNIGNWLTSVLMSGMETADLLLVGMLLSANSAAYYKAALGITNMIWIPTLLLQQMLVNETARESLWTSPEKMSSYLSQSLRHSLSFVLLAVLGIIFFGENFVSIYYGQSYIPAVEPLLVLTLGTIFFAISRIFLGIVQGQSRRRALIFVIGASVATNLIGNIWAIPRFGITGAAFITAISYGVMYLVLYFTFFAWKDGISITGIKLPQLGISCLVASIPFWIGAELIQTNLFSMIIIGSIGASLYIISLFITGILNIQEILYIVEELPDGISTPIKSILEKIT